MYYRTNVTYIYDGSFDGLMNCVFESFKMRELPQRVIKRGEIQFSLFENIEINTDENRASRVKNGIKTKIGNSMLRFLKRAYLTCLEDKEKYIISMAHIGFKSGKKSIDMVDNPVVDKLRKAVSHLTKESHLLKEFLRFSIYDEVMIAQITPKNFVLPFLGPHFVNRFPDDNFLIYDKTHRAAFVYENNNSKIVDLEELNVPDIEINEIKYRRLWKQFYHTIGIKERENSKCRMSHMPKRYWQNLTEFAWDKEFDEEFYFEKSGDSFLKPL